MILEFSNRRFHVHPEQQPDEKFHTNVDRSKVENGGWEQYQADREGDGYVGSQAFDINGHVHPSMRPIFRKKVISP